MFTGEELRKISGDAVIMKRMPVAESVKIRSEWQATDVVELDHIIPLQLGGSNSKGNIVI